MKDKLTSIFNTLKLIETKGDSTIIMADCMRALMQIISTLPNEEMEPDKAEVDEEAKKGA